jgi:hypothetical protein
MKNITTSIFLNKEFSVQYGSKSSHIVYSLRYQIEEKFGIRLILGYKERRRLSKVSQRRCWDIVLLWRRKICRGLWRRLNKIFNGRGLIKRSLRRLWNNNLLGRWLIIDFRGLRYGIGYWRGLHCIWNHILFWRRKIG